MSPALARHLSLHHGLVTTSVCASLGISKDVVARMVAHGELVRVHRGVYRHAAVPESFEQRVLGAVLAVGGGCVASHRTAVALYEVSRFSCHLVELTTPATSKPMRAGVVVHRTRTLPSCDVRRHRGLPVTSPARTIADAATVMSPSLVARFAEELMARRVLRPSDLDEVLRRDAHRRGAGELRLRLTDAVPAADSVPEALLGRILTKAGVPPVLHHLVTTPSGRTFELDWAYPSARLGLELDGYGVHLRSVDAFDDDRVRRNEIELAGWRVLNFGARTIRRRPDTVVDQVRRALAMSTSATP